MTDRDEARMSDERLDELNEWDDLRGDVMGGAFTDVLPPAYWEVQHALRAERAAFDRLTAELAALRAEVSELQSATKNAATRIITHHVPWRDGDKHPRRVVLAYIDQLESAALARVEEGRP